jgi:hypothetical protein
MRIREARRMRPPGAQRGDVVAFSSHVSFFDESQRINKITLGENQPVYEVKV